MVSAGKPSPLAGVEGRGARSFFQPWGDRLLVEPLETSDIYSSVNTLDGGTVEIVIPETGKERPTKGRVLAFGPEVEGFPYGTVVLFPKYAGTPVEYEDKSYLIMRVRDIHGEWLGELTNTPEPNASTA